jgi:hypothetical protein
MWVWVGGPITGKYGRRQITQQIAQAAIYNHPNNVLWCTCYILHVDVNATSGNGIPLVNVMIHMYMYVHLRQKYDKTKFS